MTKLSVGHNLPVSVHLSSMSETTRAHLEYYISNTGSPLYNQVSKLETADCIILDIDYPGASNVFEERTAQSGFRCIFLVFSVTEIPNDSIVNILKPLTLKKLEDAAVKIAELLQCLAVKEATTRTASMDAPLKADGLGSIPTLTVVAALNKTTKITANLNKSNNKRSVYKSVKDRSIEIEAGTSLSPPKNPVFSRAAPTSRAASKRDLLCGSRVDYKTPLEKKHSPYSYAKGQYLGGYLAEALQQNKNNETALSISIPVLNLYLYVQPNINRIYSNKSIKDTKTVEQIFSPLKADEVKTHFFLEPNRAQIAREIKSDRGFAYSLEAFVWLSILLSAKGRLPTGFDPDEPIRLKHWPNFTRLENTPHCFEIATCWAQKFKSLNDVISELKLQASDVIAFYNGTSALELFEHNHKNMVRKRGLLDFLLRRSTANENLR